MKKSKNKTLPCKYCKTPVEKSYETTVSITCWRCASRLADGEKLEISK
jgi:hypothetical protein